jgi:hypothetical protein
MTTNRTPKKQKPPKKERATSTNGHYVTNAQLLEAFYEARAAGKLTDRLAKYLMKVAEKYSYHPWFVRYSFREDMVCAAVVGLTMNWHKFNPDKYEDPNPFSYFTTACYRSFLAYLASERKEQDIRDELLLEAGSSPSFNYQNRHGISKTSDDLAFTNFVEE